MAQDSTNRTGRRRFYDGEEPEKLSLDNHVFRYYKNKGRLTVSLPDYLGGNGKMLIGKSVAIDLNELRESPAVAQRIIDILKENCLPEIG